MTGEQFELRKEIEALKRRIEEEEKGIRAEHYEALRRQQVRNMLLKLALLLPLAAGCTVLLVRKRDSIYRMIFASTAAAVYIKTGMVVHERFPSRYFKYALTIGLLALAGWGFVWLVRRLVKPKLELLLKQYRQAYEHFLCPVCEYPIRRGPRKHLFWTRRTVHKVALAPAGGATGAEDEVPYACPACGTLLFETCPACGKIRHGLLPACQACGATKEIAGDRY